MHAYNYVHALYNDYFVCSLLTILASMSKIDIYLHLSLSTLSKQLRSQAAEIANAVGWLYNNVRISCLIMLMRCKKKNCKNYCYILF